MMIGYAYMYDVSYGSAILLCDSTDKESYESK